MMSALSKINSKLIFVSRYSSLGKPFNGIPHSIGQQCEKLRRGSQVSQARLHHIQTVLRPHLRLCHSATTVTSQPDMKVTILSALEDNYMYLLSDEDTKEAAIVDPVNPEKVVQAVKDGGYNLTTVLTTHHHWDHAGGNEKLAEYYKGGSLTVCGGDDRIGALNKKVGDGDQFKIGNLQVTCMFTPCHTKGHICYYIQGDASEDPAVFTGDTLFISACGKFFEGTGDQMYTALIEKLGRLPDNTKVYCGHEYSVSSLTYALTVEPDNKDLQKKLEWAKEQRAKKMPTVPSSIAEEKSYNPFMRVGEPSIQKYIGNTEPVTVMGLLRKDKDNYKPKK
nr:hydroxyacylglutathione hydrolase, mitochondrial-like [Lytechinus pictus]